MIRENDRYEAAIDRLECTEIIYRIARAIDRCDADLLVAQFHPDATDDHGLFAGSAADFVAWVMPMLATMERTQHVIGQVLIEVDGDRAAGESYFTAYHAIPAGDAGQFMVVGGRYLDRFERRGGVWKMAHRTATYDWNSTAPLTDTFDRTTHGPTRFGARGGGDPSYIHFASLRPPSA